MPTPWSRATKPVWTVQPTTKPLSISTMRMPALYTTSADVRPVSTAERAIGSERKRSMIPLLMSSHIPMAVVAAANTMVWAKMPGIRYSL